MTGTLWERERVAAARWEGHDRRIMGEGEGGCCALGRTLPAHYGRGRGVAAVRWEGHDRHIMGEGEGGCCALGRT